jgi:D-arabinose 1-dehydrogenase-like Zn-dependent alcohol dehydrogenase
MAGKCEACKEGEEQYCEKEMNTTFNGYDLGGKMPTYAGYSTCITVNEEYERVLNSDVHYRFVIDMASLKQPCSAK